MKIICNDCGNQDQFIFNIVCDVFVSFTKEIFIEPIAKSINNEVEIALSTATMLSQGHIRNLKYTQDIMCANCNSWNIIPFNEYLCFAEDIDKQERIDGIIDGCCSCLSILKKYSKDPEVFSLSLSLDLVCSGCPVLEEREKLGVNNDIIRREFCGKLV